MPSAPTSAPTSLTLTAAPCRYSPASASWAVMPWSRRPRTLHNLEGAMSEHELWNELGNLYFMSGAYNQAIHAYERSIKCDTSFGRPYSNLALTYVQQGKYEEAVELYRR